MKIKINKKSILKSLERLLKAHDSSSHLSALQGILITVVENQLTIVASNGNLSIKEVLTAGPELEITEPGRILIQGKLFSDVIKKQGDDITITKERESAIIKSLDSKVVINLLDANDFPMISFDNFGEEFIIPVDSLKSIISDVSFAAADKDKRIILNGVNLVAENNKLVAAATNSFRLAHKEMPIDSSITFNMSILSKNLKQFLPSNAKGDIKIWVTDAKIVTQFENTTVVSKLIDGVYPNVSGLIPASFEHSIKIQAKELSSLIDKAMVMSTENNSVVRMTANQDVLKLESKREEVGNLVANSNSFTLEGQDLEIAFNVLFLKEALSKFKGEVTLKFNGGQKPFIITSDSNEKLIQLILPHRSY